tara:strand:+ start:981 stop:1388 length:408 start_codon:yes stop_codon:yes gene_type:complete
MNKKLSKNWSSREFECSCRCETGEMDMGHIEKLQELRDAMGVALKVTSGIRCEEHNNVIRGAKKSWHVPRSGICYASDIAFAHGSRNNSRTLKLYVLADQLGFKGLGLYRGRIHTDSRPGKKARWIDHFWNWRDT